MENMNVFGLKRVYLVSAKVASMRKMILALLFNGSQVKNFLHIQSQKLIN